MIRIMVVSVALTSALAFWLGAFDFSANGAEHGQAKADAERERTMRVIVAEELTIHELRALVAKGGEGDEASRYCSGRVFDRGSFAFRCSLSLERRPIGEGGDVAEYWYWITFAVFKDAATAESPTKYERTDELFIGRRPQ